MAENSLVVNVTLNNFSTLVIERSQEVPVMVDFWAAWCAPCQVLMPMLARLAQQYQGKFVLAKVNTDQERELAQQYGVRNLPTVKIFRHGKVVEEFMGAQPESVVRSYLDRHVDRQSDQLRQQAVAAQQQGDLDSALVYLRRAVELEPANQALQLDVARLLVERSEWDAARTLLQTLPEERAEVRTLLAYLDLAVIAQGVNRQALEARLTADPADHEARYGLATSHILDKQYPEAMDHLLEIIRCDRGFRNDGARKALLTIFDLLGHEHDLVMRYRKRLVSLLH